MTDTATPDADVVPMTAAKKTTAKKAAKKVAKKAPAAKAANLEDPVPLSALFADDGIDWDVLDGDSLTFEQWNRLGDNVTRSDVGGPWWVGDWWVKGEGLFTEEQMVQVIDPLRIMPKTVSNRAWLARKIPREHRRVTTVGWSLHRLAAEAFDDLAKIDEVLARIDEDGLTYRQTEKLIREMKGEPAKPEPDDEEDPPEDPTRCHGEIRISADVAYADDVKAITQKLRDMADEMLAEHGVGGARVTSSVD